MQRGQISIDLTLTILVAMLFLQGMAILMTDIAESQQNISIRSQGRAILNEVARLYTLNEELSDLEIGYTVPKIRGIGERRPFDCEINYADPQLTLDIDLDGDGAYGVTPEELAVAVTRDTTPLSGAFPINCGATVTIG